MNIRSKSIVSILIFLCCLCNGLQRLCSQVAQDASGIGTLVSLNADTFEITGGTTTGSNLFHSFDEFSIASGQTAHFLNGAVENIFSRVTGGGVSDIDGVIKVDHSANLFLINPAGFIFGPDAALDLSGSVHITSADFITLGSGGRFDADDPANDVLTSDEVSGFGFLGEVPGPIEIQGSTLQVSEGEKLEFTGGGFSVSEGDDEALVSAPSGRLGIVSLASSGFWNLTDTSDFSKLGDLNVKDSSRLSVDGTGTGGIIYIRGNNFYLDSAEVLSGTSSSSGPGNDIDISLTGVLHAESGSSIVCGTKDDGDAGSIEIKAADIILDSGSYIENTNLNDPLDDSKTGSTGGLIIQAGNLTLSNGSYIDNSTYTAGSVGNTVIEISQDIRLNDAKIFSNVSGSGDGGDLLINCGRLIIESGGAVDFSNYGSGTSGDLDVNAGTEIVIDGAGNDQSGIYNDLEDGFAGIGNRVSIRTPRLTLTNGGVISCRTYNQNDGSDLFIDVSGLIKIDGYYLEDGDYSKSSIYSGTWDDGNGGDITIKAQRIEISAGGEISGESRGNGDASDITIQAEQSLDIQGYYMDAENEDFPDDFSEIGSCISNGSREDGAGGEIRVTSPLINVSNFGEIECGAWDTGTGGIIRLNAVTLNLSSNGYINTASWGAGAGGDIYISTGKLSISSDAGVDSSGEEGPGGDIFIVASESLKMDQGYIEAGSYDIGNAGDISVQSPLVILDRDSYVSAETEGEGSGGDVLLDVSRLCISGGSSITAKSSQEGTAGDVTIKAVDRIEMDSSEISVLSEKEDGGDITISTSYWLKMTDSRITAEVRGGSGDGGNIFIDPVYVILQNSQIIANAYGGAGGNIRIVTGLFIKNAYSLISASSRLGIDGEVEITAPDIDISGALRELPSNLYNTSLMLPQRCVEKNIEESGTFMISGKGGHPHDPEMLLQLP